jgi:hypothetical protein
VYAFSSRKAWAVRDHDQRQLWLIERLDLAGRCVLVEVPELGQLRALT